VLKPALECEGLPSLLKAAASSRNPKKIYIIPNPHYSGGFYYGLANAVQYLNCLCGNYPDL
jgi:hypothetical protein